MFQTKMTLCQVTLFPSWWTIFGPQGAACIPKVSLCVKFGLFDHFCSVQLREINAFFSKMALFVSIEKANVSENLHGWIAWLVFGGTEKK